MNRGLTFLVLNLFIMILAACHIIQGEPISPIERADLIGKWVANYDQYDYFALPQGGKETLILHENGSFEQYFEKISGIPFQKRSSGQWKVEEIDGEWMRISLEGAMYYLEGLQNARNASKLDAWDPVLNKHITIQSGSLVVLYAKRLSWDSKYDSKIPCGKKFDIILQHLPIGDLDAPTWVIFCRDPEASELRNHAP